MSNNAEGNMPQDKGLTLCLFRFAGRWHQLLGTGLQDTVQLAGTAQRIEAYSLHYKQLDNITYAKSWTSQWAAVH